MKQRRKKTIWSFGDVFTIKLKNQNYAIGHVLDQRLPNTIRIALYDEVIESLKLKKSELDEIIAEGTYSNLAIINHSASEFVVDFVCIMPGAPKAKVKSRIVLTPQHAKRLVKALAENIQRFEQIHGEIKDSEQRHIPMNFGPTGQA